MKQRLLIALFVVIVNNVRGQKHLFVDAVEGKVSVNFALYDVNNCFISPPLSFDSLKSGSKFIKIQVN